MGKFIRFKLNRCILVFGLLLTTVGCDQVTKVIAREALLFGRLDFLGDFIRLQLVENPGAFLSLGADLGSTLRFWIFTIAVGLFVAGGFLYLLFKKELNRWNTIGLTLIVAGGIGNLIDRAMKGTVTDFMNLGVGWLRTGVFNVADVAITLGVILLIFKQFSAEKHNA